MIYQDKSTNFKISFNKHIIHLIHRAKLSKYLYHKMKIMKIIYTSIKLVIQSVT